jgi:transposase
LPKDAYERYILNGIRHVDNQVMNEIDYLFTTYNLAPKMFIAYDRTSYSAKDFPELRLTFDTNLRSRVADIEIDNHENCLAYFDDVTYILEIKTTGGLPRWLINSLTKHHIHPTSFSKYGKLYQAAHKKEVTYAG